MCSTACGALSTAGGPCKLCCCLSLPAFPPFSAGCRAGNCLWGTYEAVFIASYSAYSITMDYQGDCTPNSSAISLPTEAGKSAAATPQKEVYRRTPRLSSLHAAYFGENEHLLHICLKRLVSHTLSVSCSQVVTESSSVATALGVTVPFLPLYLCCWQELASWPCFLARRRKRCSTSTLPPTAPIGTQQFNKLGKSSLTTPQTRAPGQA